MAETTRSIGRFTNAELIGRGGFGTVYQASDPDHGRDVAIKVLLGALNDTERRRFDRERQTMGKLGSHPNIIPVHESGYTDQGEGYIVMELATGGSLQRRIDSNGALGWEEATSIASSIARAAQAAHDQGVLHRDIKPDNILIDSYGNPRLTDFGIAAVASNATATKSTTATVAHAAPEVLQGDQGTAAIDVYAIGSTFYNLILGTPPFKPNADDVVSAVVARALTQPPPDIRLNGVPDAIAQVAERSLSKDPSGRQATADQLALELDQALEQAKKPNPASTVMAPVVAAQPDARSNPMATVMAPAVSADPRTTPTAPTPVSSPPPPPASQPPIAPPTPATYQHPTPPTPSPAYAVPASAVAAGTAGATPAYQPAQAKDNGGRRNGLVLIIALLAALVGVLGALLYTNSNRTTTDAATSSTSSPTSLSTTLATTGSTSADTGTSVGSSTTVAQATTQTTSNTTASSSATTATTITNPNPSKCPGGTAFDGRTSRFDVTMCVSASGQLQYNGAKRGTTESIQLSACMTDDFTFVARNKGFAYTVDPFGLDLRVTDPGGETVVLETITPITDLNLELEMNHC